MGVARAIRDGVAEGPAIIVLIMSSLFAAKIIFLDPDTLVRMVGESGASCIIASPEAILSKLVALNLGQSAAFEPLPSVLVDFVPTPADLHFAISISSKNNISTRCSEGIEAAEDDISSELWRRQITWRAGSVTGMTARARQMPSTGTSVFNYASTGTIKLRCTSASRFSSACNNLIFSRRDYFLPLLSVSMHRGRSSVRDALEPVRAQPSCSTSRLTAQHPAQRQHLRQEDRVADEA